MKVEENLVATTGEVSGTMSEIDEGEEEVRISWRKISKSWGQKVQQREDSQYHCNNNNKKKIKKITL